MIPPSDTLKSHASSTGYRRDIDGLRAIAILAVILFHAFPRGLRGGFVGVDVFFVISGFLIGGIIEREIRERRFTLTHFYARRARRIFPALIVVLISVVATGALILLPGEYRQLGVHVAGGVGFVENIILYRESGYFDTASESKPLLHLWSLAVEEQFYLFFPLLLLLLRGSYERRGKSCSWAGAHSAGRGLSRFLGDLARTGDRAFDPCWNECLDQSRHPFKSTYGCLGTH